MPKNKQKKKPTSKVKIKAQKKPRTDSAISPESSHHKKPAWKLAKMDFGGDWGFNKINRASILRELHRKLRNFEGMTWAEIERATGRSGKLNHSIRIDRLKTSVQNRLRELRLLEEHDYLYSLHFDATGRLWGIKDNEIFYILWWDQDHTVYPVTKRYT